MQSGKRIQTWNPPNLAPKFRPNLGPPSNLDTGRAMAMGYGRLQAGRWLQAMIGRHVFSLLEYSSSVSSNFLTRETSSRPPRIESENGSVSTTCQSQPPIMCPSQPQVRVHAPCIRCRGANSSANGITVMCWSVPHTHTHQRHAARVTQGTRRTRHAARVTQGMRRGSHNRSHKARGAGHTRHAGAGHTRHAAWVKKPGVGLRHAVRSHKDVAWVTWMVM